MFTQQNEVALFIDFENIHTSIKNSGLDANYVDWRLLLDECEKFGRIVIRKAYTDWAEMAKYQNALARYGIESQNAFGRGKNVTDIYLAVEAMETLHTHPEIATFIIVSGDGDFSILVHRLRNHHKNVVGVGVRGATSQGLVEACDEFIFYDDLMAVQQTERKAQAAAQQAEEARIREQERLIREQEQQERAERERVERAERASRDAEQQQRRKKPAQSEPPAKRSEAGIRKLGDLVQSALPEDGSWLNGATLVYRLRGLSRTFDRDMQREGYKRFRDLLEVLPNLDLRSAPGKGHMEVRLHGIVQDQEEQEEYPLEDLPEEEVYDEQYYLDVLEELRPRVTPSTQRPNIILRIFNIMKEKQPHTLNRLKMIALDELQTYTNIDDSLVEEIIHQLYHTYSFEFEKLQDVPQWDRPVAFQEHIQRGGDLLDNCDLGILRRLRRGMPEDVALDPAIIAYILYGIREDARILNRASTLIARVESEER